LPQKDTSERTALLITVAVVVLAVLAGGAVYLWGNSRLNVLLAQIKKVDAAIEAADTRIQAISGLQDRLRERQEAANEYLQRLPDTLEIDSLLKQIALNVKESNLRLILLEKSRTKLTRQTKTGGQEPYEKFTYSLQLKGDYPSFVEFVHRMEYEMPRFFVLNSFSITADSGGLVPGTKEHDFKLEFVTYAFAKKAEAAPKPAATTAKTVKKGT
jgi:Tfp pilus assembly protein PilO